jgi:dihydroorotate dehydrogenase electron transfer subunit
MIQECGPVRSLKFIRPAIFELWLELPILAAECRPGQFIHLLIEGSPGVMLRRPISIAGTQEGMIRLLIRIVGEGTTALSKVAVGTVMDAIGPLGNPFDTTGIKQALLVAGGIGHAPLLFLQEELTRRGIPTAFFLGARTHEEFPLSEKEVAQHSIIAATDDGSYGKSGFVSVHVEQWLRENALTGVSAYSCGPLPMMKEIDRLCRLHHLPHQVSLENRMGCGIGVCQGCAVRLGSGKNDPRGGYRLVCKDGPVFDAMEIEWALLEK